MQIELKRVKNPQLAGGKPVGHLQVWPRIWTRDYREQIQQAVKAQLFEGRLALTQG